MLLLSAILAVMSGAGAFGLTRWRARAHAAATEGATQTQTQTHTRTHTHIHTKQTINASVPFAIKWLALPRHKANIFGFLQNLFLLALQNVAI